MKEKKNTAVKNTLGRKRRIKFGVISGGFTVIFIGAVLLVNVLCSALTAKFPLKLDLTDQGIYEIGAESTEYVKNLDEKVTISVFSPESAFDVQIIEVIKKYAQLSDMVDFQVVDLNLNPEIAKKYQQNGETINTASIVVESAKRYKVLSYNDLYQQSSTSQSQTNLKTEQKMTSAIMYVSSDEIPGALVTTGHDEVDASALTGLLEDNAFSTGEINLLTEEVPENTRVIVIYGAQRDFTAEEIEKLDAFMMRGDTAVLIFQAPSLPDTPVLDAYMSEWGLKVENDLILDDGSFYGSVINPFALYAENDITEDLSTNASFVSPFSSSVTRIFDGKNDYSTFDLLLSSDSAYAKTLDANTQLTTYDKEAGDKTGQMVFGAGSSKLVNGHNTVVYSNMFVFGSLDMAGSGAMGITSFTNSDFFASLANSVRGEDGLITVAPKYIDTHPLTIQSTTEILVMLVLLVVVIPIALVVAGIVVFVRRRHL